MTAQNLQKFLPGVQENVLLAQHTTFRIGGPAKYFLVAKKREDLIKAIQVAKKHNLPFFVLGGGSNLLVSDRGYNGLVIKIHNSKFQIRNSEIAAEAGTTLAQMVAASAKSGLTGLEWAAGIPGTIGGAVRGNAAAFGGSTKDIIKRVEFFNIDNREIGWLNNKECRFAYRNSLFKHGSSASQEPNLIILAAEIELKNGNADEIKKQIRHNLDYRREHHPINFPSAGSIFKNPKLKIKAQKLIDQFPLLKEFNKKNDIPAGFLIDKCGLKKKTIGRAQISEKHANFIINLEGAKAEHVLQLIDLAKKKVKEKFALQLEEEICFLGF